jgi:hypothetical protein
VASPRFRLLWWAWSLAHPRLAPPASPSPITKRILCRPGFLLLSKLQKSYESPRQTRHFIPRSAPSPRGSLSAEYLNWTWSRLATAHPSPHHRGLSACLLEPLNIRRLRDFPGPHTPSGRPKNPSRPYRPLPTSSVVLREHGGAFQASIRLAVADVLVSLIADMHLPRVPRAATCDLRAAGHYRPGCISSAAPRRSAHSVGG